MRNTRLSFFLGGALVALLFAACAGQSKDDSTANSTPVGGSDSSSVGGSAVQLFPNSTAGTGISSPYGSGPTADSSVDGRLVIPTEKYQQLTTNLTSVCQGTVVEVEPDQSVIEFLVDVSGSMLVATPTTGGKSKWEVTRTAIKDAVKRVPPNYGIGITFFPNMDLVASTTAVRPATACIDSSKDVPIALADANQQQRIADALDAITPFQLGATPTFEAYGVAVNQLKQTPILGKRYVVLITDGQPTQGQGCVGSGGTCDTVTPTPTAPIVEAIATASSVNTISTFVVGSPGSEKTVCTGVDTRGWLSDSALQGGTGPAGCSNSGPNYCHFDVSQSQDFGVALTDALTNITKALISCSYQVPAVDRSQEVDPATTSLLFDSGAGEYFMLLPTLSGCEKGWKFSDATNTSLDICGVTCDVLQNNPAAKLSILFGCKTDVLLQ